jgi:hypothetical protein
LDAGETVLKQAAGSEAANVDERDPANSKERDDRLTRQHELHERQRQRDDRRCVCGERHEPAQVSGKRNGARRDRSRKTSDERRPAAEERSKRTVGFAQVHVLAAGTGLESRQFGVGHRAGECERTAREPDEQDAGAVRDRLRDEHRHEEDAAADDVGNDDRRSVKWAESALERPRRFVHGARSGLEKRALYLEFTDLRPLNGTVLPEHLDARIHEL